MVSRAFRTRCRAALRYWRPAVLILTPLVLLALPLLDNQQPRRAWCGYTMLVMAVYWVSEVLPLPATALLPVLLLPITGVLSTKDTCSVYMGSANMLFAAGLMVAAGVEHSGLHLRIALRVLLAVGDGVPHLMLGFMITSMFLSMWISNTACTAMMVPIVAQVIDTILETQDEQQVQNEHSTSRQQKQQEERLELPQEDTTITNTPPQQQLQNIVEFRKPRATSVTETRHDDEILNDKVSDNHSISRGRLSAALYISVAYAANCGGTGTLTGTAPNLVLAGQLQQSFGPDTGLTYASFMMFTVPVMLVCTLLGWLWLNLLFFGPRYLKSCLKSRKKGIGGDSRVRKVLQQRYDQLGAINFHQCAILVLFLILILLWITRDPKFTKGWQSLFPAVGISDASPAIFIALLLFAIPAEPRQLLNKTRYEPLLTWPEVERKVPWGVLILLGGGFALARAARESGLSELLGLWLQPAIQLPAWLAALLISSATAAVTELCSNSATATVLLPVLAEGARRANTHPLMLMLPATIAASYAFMLPVATPPNAIVYQAGRLRTSQMVRAGLMMNVLALLTVNLFLNTLGVAIFDLDTTPAWLNSTVTTVT